MNVELERFKCAYRDCTDFNYDMIARSRDSAIRRSWDNLSDRAKLFRFRKQWKYEGNSPEPRIKIRKSYKPKVLLQSTCSSRSVGLRAADLIPKMSKSIFAMIKHIKVALQKPTRRSIQEPPSPCLLVQRKSMTTIRERKKSSGRTQIVAKIKLIKSSPKRADSRILTTDIRQNEEFGRDTFHDFESLDLGSKPLTNESRHPSSHK